MLILYTQSDGFKKRPYRFVSKAVLCKNPGKNLIVQGVALHLNDPKKIESLMIEGYREMAEENEQDALAYLNFLFLHPIEEDDSTDMNPS